MLEQIKQILVHAGISNDEIEEALEAVRVLFVSKDINLEDCLLVSRDKETLTASSILFERFVLTLYFLYDRRVLYIASPEVHLMQSKLGLYLVVRELPEGEEPIQVLIVENSPWWAERTFKDEFGMNPSSVEKLPYNVDGLERGFHGYYSEFKFEKLDRIN